MTLVEIKTILTICNFIKMIVQFIVMINFITYIYIFLLYYSVEAILILIKCTKVYDSTLHPVMLRTMVVFLYISVLCTEMEKG